MSWRYLIDARGDNLKIDRARLAIVVLAALAVSRLAFWLLPRGWAYTLLLVPAVAGIAAEVWLGKRSGDRP